MSKFEHFNADGRPASSHSWGKIVGIAAGIIAALILIFNSAYQIGEQEQAVLITFGQAAAVTEPSSSRCAR